MTELSLFAVLETVDKIGNMKLHLQKHRLCNFRLKPVTSPTLFPYSLSKTVISYSIVSVIFELSQDIAGISLFGLVTFCLHCVALFDRDALHNTRARCN